MDEHSPCASLIQMHALRAWVDAKFDGLDREIQLRDKAVDVARTALDHRLEGMNEMREQMAASEAKNITRAEWSIAHAAIELKMTDFTKSSDDRFQALSRLVYMGVGAALILNMVFMYFLKR